MYFPLYVQPKKQNLMGWQCSDETEQVLSLLVEVFVFLYGGIQKHGLSL